MKSSKEVWYGNNFKLGILGGGQLGRMIIQEAISLNVHIFCLDPDPNAPCSQISNGFTNGSITDYQTDVVTTFMIEKDDDTESFSVNEKFNFKKMTDK